MFALWFASGAVLLFEPFPSLPKAEGQALGRTIDQAAVVLTPVQALAAAGGGTAVRLRQRGDAPAYIVAGGAHPVVIDASNGRRMPLLSPQAAASVFGPGLPARGASVVGPFGYDQWVVHNQFDALRPFYRVDLADPVGTQIYVSARTGDIVQRTTRWQRGWNWVGAVLHWAYVTPLRSSFAVWDRTVWIVSFVAMLVADAGMILGIVRMLAVRRARRPGLTFYRQRWMRWHHLVGLFAGIFVLTWILSGWLSMDHGRLFSRGQPTDAQVARYSGLPANVAAASVDGALLRRLPPANEIAITSVADVPLLAITDQNGKSGLLTIAGVPVAPAKADELIAKGLGRAWGTPPALSGVSVPLDDFYSLAEGLPPSARRFAGADARPPVYVDGGTGNILVVMSTSRAAYAWIYYALHSFNFPGVARHQVLRDILVLIPLTAGFLFSITGVVLGWQRLRKSTVPAKSKEITR
ncbi:peptidase [uncultured Sphingomonas sp.]|uniref:peptidase n=1 Tax=uncultured Sphingomonas sp. TaxID=158754 RepID=UPI0035CAF419